MGRTLNLVSLSVRLCNFIKPPSVAVRKVQSVVGGQLGPLLDYICAHISSKTIDKTVIMNEECVNVFGVTFTF